jgi:hypothetical protein
MKPLLAAAILLGLTHSAVASEPVRDAITAEKIGAVALKAKIGPNYDHYVRDLSWQAALRGDYWFAMPVIPANIGADLMEMQGWIVQIDKNDGKVLGVYLQF